MINKWVDSVNVWPVLLPIQLQEDNCSSGDTERRDRQLLSNSGDHVLKNYFCTFTHLTEKKWGRGEGFSYQQLYWVLKTRHEYKYMISSSTTVTPTGDTSRLPRTELLPSAEYLSERRWNRNQNIPRPVRCFFTFSVCFLSVHKTLKPETQYPWKAEERLTEIIADAVTDNEFVYCKGRESVNSFQRQPPKIGGNIFKVLWKEYMEHGYCPLESLAFATQFNWFYIYTKISQ